MGTSVLVQVGLTGIFALLGVVLGQGLTSRLERRRWQREDQFRWKRETHQVYGSFLAALEDWRVEVKSHPVHEDAVRSAQRRVLVAWAGVALLASPAVAALADNVRIYCGIHVLLLLGESSDDVDDAMENAIDAMDTKLGRILDELLAAMKGDLAVEPDREQESNSP
jgi:hypothetical protein